MKKALICSTLLVFLCFSHTLGRCSADEGFQDKVQRAIEAMQSRGPSKREKFVDVDTKKARFSHKGHQQLIKRLNKPCTICHHKLKKGRSPRVCRSCHYGKKIVSKGKYARAGQIVKLKDAFHLLCGGCHARMLKDSYRRVAGSPAKIPSKCHHCHVPK